MRTSGCSVYLWHTFLQLIFFLFLGPIRLVASMLGSSFFRKEISLPWIQPNFNGRELLCLMGWRVVHHFRKPLWYLNLHEHKLMCVIPALCKTCRDREYFKHWIVFLFSKVARELIPHMVDGTDKKYQVGVRPRTTDALTSNNRLSQELAQYCSWEHYVLVR